MNILIYCYVLACLLIYLYDYLNIVLDIQVSICYTVRVDNKEVMKMVLKENIGKKYHSYGGGIDLILNVIPSAIWGEVYLVEDEKGVQRTHCTHIKSNEFVN